jgi:hypothetical protein
MKKLTTFLLVAALAAPLMGCSMVKKFTGQRDDSILPGTREDILPPEAQTARDPGVTGENKTAKCAPDNPNCANTSTSQEPAPIDQDSSTPQ